MRALLWLASLVFAPCYMAAAAWFESEMPRALNTDLASVKGVEAVHDLHVWSLSMGKLAMSAHIESDTPLVTLKKATRLCRLKYQILHSTI